MPIIRNRFHIKFCMAHGHVRMVKNKGIEAVRVCPHNIKLVGSKQCIGAWKSREIYWCYDCHNEIPVTTCNG